MKTTVLVMAPLLVVADMDGLRKTLESIERDWEENRFTTAYTVQYGNVTKEEYMGDVSAVRKLLDDIEQDPEAALRKQVEAVRKKKNGLFWSRSGTTIRMMTSISDYFTDFTNAWSVAQLRLEVIDDTTCELVLRFRTETH